MIPILNALMHYSDAEGIDYKRANKLGRFHYRLQKKMVRRHER